MIWLSGNLFPRKRLTFAVPAPISRNFSHFFRSRIFAILSRSDERVGTNGARERKERTDRRRIIQKKVRSILIANKVNNLEFSSIFTRNFSEVFLEFWKIGIGLICSLYEREYHFI